MIAKNILYLQSLCLLLIAGTILSTACPNGMTRTDFYSGNVKAKGKAGHVPLSIAWHEGVGALWLNRKISIKPRWQWSAKIVINDKACSETSWTKTAIDGFTMIVSGSTNNYMGGGGGNLGYKGIDDAIVTEIDLWKNNEFEDKNANQITIRHCPKGQQCTPNENSNTKRWNIGYEYDKCKTMVYDVTLRYENGKTEVFIGGNLKVALDFDTNNLGNGHNAYIGMTAYLRGYKRDFRVEESAFCEDKIAQITLDEKDIKVQVPVEKKIVFTARNIQSKKIGSVWLNSMSFGISCGTLSQVSSSGGKLSTTLSGCNKAGTYTITPKVNNLPIGDKTDITVLPGRVHRLILKNVHGEKKGEDFILGSRITAELDVSDAYGNSIELEGVSSSDYVTQVTNPNGNMYVVNLVNGVFTHDLNNNNDTAGNYRLVVKHIPTNTKKEFTIKVTSGEPSVENSMVQLAAPLKSTPEVDENTDINVDVNLFDTGKNIVSGDEITKAGGAYRCEAVRNSALDGIEKMFDGKTKSTDNGFLCIVNASLAGTYTVNAYITLKDQNENQIPAGINSFDVKFHPSDISNIQFKDFDTDRWVTRGRYNLKLVKDAEFITLIDFSYYTNKYLGLVSDLYSKKFKLTELTGSISNSFIREYKDDLSFSWSKIGLATYIAVKPKSGKSWIKKSTDDYNMTLTLNGKSITFNLRYPLGNTNGEQVCVDELLPEYTIYEPTENYPKITLRLNEDASVGTIYTRTMSDCLYNYWADAKRFTFTKDSEDGVEWKGTYVKKTDIEGIYDVRMNPQEPTRSEWLYGQMDKMEYIRGYEIEVRAEQLIKFFKVESRSNKFKDERRLVLEDQSSDVPVDFIFTGLDASRRTALNINPARTNKYLGLTIDVKINGQSNISNWRSRNTSIIVYDRRSRGYKFTDSFTEAGKYEVTVTASGGETLEFSYTKNPGVPVAHNSSAMIISDMEIKYDEVSRVSVNLQDQYGSAIAKHSYEEDLKLMDVVVSHESGANVVKASFEKVEGDNLIFLTPGIQRVGIWNLSVKHSGRASGRNRAQPFTVACMQRCSFNVKYGDIYIKNTRSNIILSATKRIYEHTYQQVANTKDVMIFNSFFYDIGNNWIGALDTTQTDITANITGTDMKTVSLIVSWVNNNQAFFNIKKDDYVTIQRAVSTGKYHFNIFYKGVESLKYPLKFLGDGNDSDAGNGEPDFNNTIIDDNTLVSVAGKTVETRIEFRTAANLRVNYYQDISKFTFTQSLNDATWKASVQKGNKKGTYIITMESKVKTKIGKENMISFKFDGKPAHKVHYFSEHMFGAIEHKVLCAMLHNFEFEKSAIHDAATGELLPGNVMQNIYFDLKARDKYGNIFDPLFNTNIYELRRIVAMFSYTHSEGENVTVVASTNPSAETFTLQVRTKKVGTITFNSVYLDNFWSKPEEKKTMWNRWGPGPMSHETSYAKVQNKDSTLVAGEKAVLDVYPFDKYENIVPIKVTNKDDENVEALVNMSVPQEHQQELSQSSVDESKNVIVKMDKLITAGQSTIEATHEGRGLNCIGCTLTIQLGPVKYAESQLFIVGQTKDVLVNARIPVMVQNGSYPSFKLFLRDEFKNKYKQIPNGSVYTATVTEHKADIKLCTNINGDHVEIEVCEDKVARNVWKHLLSKPNYKLTINQDVNGKVETLNYKLSIVGGVPDDEASNGEMDITKTFLSRSEIETTAGTVESFNIECRTAEGKRDNYWFLEPTKKITIKYGIANGAPWYKTVVSKGAKPGQYTVKVTSTKAYRKIENNNIQVTIDGKVVPTTLPYTVHPAAPIRGDVFDKDMNNSTFIDGNADFLYTINVILYDRYNNIADIPQNEYNYHVTQPNGNKYTTNVVKINDGRMFRITFYPRIAGVYHFHSTIINDSATPFNVYPGIISHRHSQVVAPVQRVAGEKLDVHVIAFDSWNNYVDPNAVEVNPFGVFHKMSTGVQAFTKEDMIADDAYTIGSYKLAKKINNFNPKQFDRRVHLSEKKAVRVNFKQDGKCMSANAGKLNLVDCSNASNQDWKITHKENKFYTVKNIGTNDCLKSEGLGAEAISEACSDASNQSWEFFRNLNDGEYYIKNKLTTYVLDIVSSKMTMQTNQLNGGKTQRISLLNSSTKRRLRSLEEVDEMTVATYKYTLTPTVAATWIFRAEVGEQDSKCINCETLVIAAAESFEHLDIRRYDTNNQFVTMPAAFSEDNTKKNPIYRIYPMDRFGNRRDNINKADFAMTFIDGNHNFYELSVFENKTDEYVQFVAVDGAHNNKDKYENLVAGKYKLRIGKISNMKWTEKDVTLLGTKADNDANNDPLDIQKTIITESDLSIVAGQSGHIIVKLQTTSGRRRNEWGHKVVLTALYDDKAFKFDAQEAGKKGTYYVSWTTTLATNFPTPGINYLFSISIDDKLVQGLNQKIEVTPERMNACAVRPIDLQAPTELNDGSADHDMLFGMSCKDKYNNDCEMEIDNLNVQIFNPKGTVMKRTESHKIGTAIVHFMVESHLAGLYKITTDKRFISVDHFTYNNSPGLLVEDNTNIKCHGGVVTAGDNVSLEVIGNDQYMNNINADLVVSRFDVDIKTVVSTINTLASTNANKTMYFKNQVTRRDLNEWIVKVDDKEIECSCIMMVQADKAKLENTVFMTNNIGELQKNFKSGTLITRDNELLQTGTIYLRDQYMNVLPKIDESLYKVVTAIITGNNANTVFFSPSLINGGSVWNMEITDYHSIRQVSRLIASTGYELAFTIKAGEEYKAFTYPLTIISDRDETGRGNGNYVPEKTKLAYEKLALVAGNTDTVDITLRTSQDLIFNDSVDVEKTFSYELNKEDKNMVVDFNRKGAAFGIYSVDVTTTTVWAEDELNMTIFVNGLEADKKFKVGVVNVYSMAKLPPVSESTILVESPKSPHMVGKSLVWKFKLFDSFGNQIKDKSATNFLLLKNHLREIKTVNTYSEGIYTITHTNLIYPPRNAKYRIYFKQGDVTTRVVVQSFPIFLDSEVDYDNTVVSSTNINEMNAGEELDVTVTLFDSQGLCVDTENQIDMATMVVGPKGPASSVRKYAFKVFKDPSLKECINRYNIEVPMNSRQILAGEYEITVNVAGKTVKTATQKVNAINFDRENFVVVAPDGSPDFDALKAGQQFVHEIYARDSYNNIITTPFNKKFSIKLHSKVDGVKLVQADLNGSSVEKNGEGRYIAKLQINRTGKFYFTYYYDDQQITNIDITGASDVITVIPNTFSRQYSEYFNSNLSSVKINEEAHVSFWAFDSHKNKQIAGGLQFKANIQRVTGTVSLEDESSKITDNGDGSYTLKFIPTVEAKYTITISTGELTYGERPLEYIILNAICSGTTSVRCPNNPGICVSSILGCLPKNDCPIETPFFGDINGETNCLESQKDFDCPKGMTECGPQKICVADSLKESQCVKEINADCPSATPFRCRDNICRLNSSQCPNQRVCPVGFVICPDLTCVTDYSKCNSHSACGIDQVRCPDQSCKDKIEDCQSLITCPEFEMVVCPNGKCYHSELQCRAPQVCGGDKAFMCFDGTCANNFTECPVNAACGQGKALCETGPHDRYCKTICNENADKPQKTAEEIQREMNPDHAEDELRKQLEANAEAEANRLAEIERLRVEAEKKRIAEENARLAKIAEEKRLAEEARLKKIADEKERERQRKIEEARLKAEAEAAEKKRLEDERIAAEKAAEAERKRIANVRAGFDKIYKKKGITFPTTRGVKVNAQSTFIMLTHLNTKNNLHSHTSHQRGREQEVTGYWGRDGNDWFVLEQRATSDATWDISKNKFSLRHYLTRKNVWIDPHNKSTKTKQKEVTARWYKTGRSENDFTIKKVYDYTAGVDPNTLVVGDMITIANGNIKLHSHTSRYSGGSKQYEVTGYTNGDSNDYWVVTRTSSSY